MGVSEERLRETVSKIEIYFNSEGVDILEAIQEYTSKEDERDIVDYLWGFLPSQIVKDLLSTKPEDRLAVLCEIDGNYFSTISDMLKKASETRPK